MNSERQKLINLFLAHTLKYKDSVWYKKYEDNKVKRVFYNFKQFGLPYIWYHLSRLRLLNFLVNRKSKLFFGKKMILPANDIGTSIYSMYGVLPHKSERKLALWIMKNLGEDEIFYDIGAHMGYYTALSEKILTNGEIHAFEANQQLCKYLDQNFLNSRNVHISCVAVADSIGEVDFYDATYVEDSSSSSRFPLLGRDIAPSRVVAITIDEYVKRGNRLPTVIKFDIEGGEYDAILGALNTIEKNKPKIVMEIWGDERGKKYSDKAIKKLQELGYKAFLIKSDGSIIRKSLKNSVEIISDHTHDVRDNFLFLKK